LKTVDVKKTSGNDGGAETRTRLGRMKVAGAAAAWGTGAGAAVRNWLARGAVAAMFVMVAAGAGWAQVSVSGAASAINGSYANLAAALAAIGQSTGFINVVLSADQDMSTRYVLPSNQYLNIIASGGTRTITHKISDPTHEMFLIQNTGSSLGLQENITIKGRSTPGTGAVVNCIGGNITMAANSKITGHNTSSANGGAVIVDGPNVNFWAYGIITENNNTSDVTTTTASGGVYFASGRIIVDGGSITGNTQGSLEQVANNTAEPSDVYHSAIIDTAFTVKGAALIGALKMNATSETVGASVRVDATGWTGSIGTLNLRGDNVDIATASGFWPERTLFRGSITADHINNKIGLGEFISQNNEREDISSRFYVGTENANLGKLFFKSEASPVIVAVSGGATTGYSSLTAALNDITVGGTYTVTLKNNQTLGARTISAANQHITLIGEGGERTVQYNGTASSRMFTISNASASLTLENNITLQGISAATSNLLYVSDGKLTMKNGSKVTGHTTTASNGTISLYASAIFEMNGGSVIGNSPLDIFKNSTSTFNLSEDAQIGTLRLSRSASSYTILNLVGAFNGTVGSLHLQTDGVSNIDQAINSWSGKQVIQAPNGYALTAADMANFTLGNFYATILSIVQEIGPAYALGTSAANMGRLILDPATAPVSVTVNGEATAYTSLADAFTAIETQAGNFTFTLRKDQIMSAARTINTPNQHITIVGEGGMQTINGSTIGTDAAMFTISNANVSLTLGNNVTIQGRSTAGAGAVVSISNGTFTMQGNSRIQGHVVNGTSGAVYMTGGTFNMLGSSVISDVTASTATSAAVYLNHANAIFNMSGGEITENNNTAAAATNTTASGGVSFIAGTFNMSGGSITENTQGTEASDVYHAVTTADAFTVSGSAQIGALKLNATSTTVGATVNAASWNGSIATLNLRGNINAITTAADYWTGSTRTIFNNITAAKVNDIGLGEFISANNGRRGISSEGYIIGAQTANSGRLVLNPATAPVTVTVGGTTTGYSTLAAAFTAIETNTGSFTVMLRENQAMTANRPIGTANQHITIVGEGDMRTINGSTIGNAINMFSISNANASLTLGDNITIQGRSTAGAGAVVSISNGTFTMQGNSRIQGHTVNGTSGAVYMTGGTFNMQGNSVISGVTASTATSAAVHINDAAATFNMQGGQIIENNNTAAAATNTNASGGVSFIAGTFNMSGGSITGNTQGTALQVIDGTAEKSDVYHAVTTDDVFTVSGSAEIGVLKLNAASATATSSVNVGADWSGGIDKINLRGQHNDIETVVSYWPDRTLFRGSITETQIGAIGLGEVISANNGRRNISPTFYIGAAGANLGKLVLDPDLAPVAVTVGGTTTVYLNLTAAFGAISGAGDFTVTLRTHQSFGTRGISAAGQNITLVSSGIGEANVRTVSGGTFELNNSTASLTLGNNITIQGHSSTPALVTVSAGTLTMEEGSKVTGHTSNAGAIYVYGPDAHFKMNGGSVTGNNNNNTGTEVSGGVTLQLGKFTMTGGSITNNTHNGELSDVYHAVTTADAFTVSGNAQVGVLRLNATSETSTSVTVGEGWSGGIGKINLRGNNNAIETVAGYWPGKTIFSGSITADKIGAIALGEFINANNTVRKNISPDFIGTTAGENLGQLIRVITAAPISLTAPVTAAQPNTAATGTGNFTPGAVSWSPDAPSKFKGNTVYTATLTLTASAGYSFTGIANGNVTINSFAATVESNTGNALTVSYEFPATAAPTVTDIAVKTQPGNMAYTHGDALGLTGIVVTLNYNDETTKDVDFANFADYGIIASPAHGDVLSHTPHNGEKVTLTLGLSSVETDELTVHKKAVSVTVTSGQTKVYGETDPLPFAYTVSPALIVGDELTGVLSRAAGEGVGTYAINQGDLANANYAITFEADNFTITQKAITVTAEAKNKVYGESDPALTYTVSPALIGGDNFSGALSRAAGEDVEVYAIGQGSLANANYAITFESANFTITQKAITVTVAPSQTKVYGEADPTAFAYSVNTQLIGADAFSGALSRAAGEDVGAYAIGQNTLTAGDNYNITFAADDFTITQRAVTVTAGAKTKVYGESDPGLTYTVSPALIGADAFTGGLSRAAGENVGTYAINRGDLANANYEITTFNGNSFEITLKSVTITGLTANNKEYDGNAVAVINNTNAAIDGNIDVANLTIVSNAATATFDDKNVGTNINVTFSGFTLGGTAAGNYTLSDQPASVQANITAKPVTITGVTVNNRAYDGGTVAVINTNTGTVEDKIDGDNLTINYGTAAFADKIVGDGKTVTFTGFSLSGTDADNYALSGTSPTTANITKKNVTITGVTVNEKVYNGNAVAEINNPGAISGKIDSDVLTISQGAAAFADKNVGNNKTVTFSGFSLGGADAGNYTLSEEPASTTANITPMPVTVTADAKSKTFGDNDPALTYSVNPVLLTGDSFSGVLEREAGTDAGTYLINQGNLANTNYSITGFNGANFVIQRKPVASVGFSVAVPETGENPATGITNGNATHYSSAIVWKKGSAEHSGSFEGNVQYTAVVTLTATANYTFTPVPTVTLNNTAVNSASINVNEAAGTLTVTHTFEATHKHDVELTIHGTNNHLYEDPGHTFTGVVYGYAQPAPLHVVITNTGNQTKNHLQVSLNGNTNFELSFSANANFGTSNITHNSDIHPNGTLNFYVRPKHGLAAGSYTATVSVKNNYDNHHVHAVDEKFTVHFNVGPRDISASASVAFNETYTYKGTSITIANPANDLVVTADGKTLAFSTEYVIGSYANNTNAGTATINITGTGNYTGDISGTFTIGKVPVTVKADNKSITYGAAVPSYTYSITPGLVNNEEKGVLGTPQYACDYVLGSNAGNYDITLSGLSSGNYEISYDNANKGKVVVGKASVESPDVPEHNIIIGHTTSFNINLTDLLPALDGSLVYGGVSYSAATTKNQGSILAGATVSGSVLAVAVKNSLSVANEGDEAEVTVTVVSGNYSNFNIVIPFAASDKIDISEHMTLDSLTVAYNGSQQNLGDVVIGGGYSSEIEPDNIKYTYKKGNTTSNTPPTNDGEYTVRAEIVDHSEYRGYVEAKLTVITLYDLGAVIHEAVEEHKEPLLGEFFNNAGSALVLNGTSIQAALINNNALANVLNSINDLNSVIEGLLSELDSTQKIIPPSSPVSGILSSSGGAPFTFTVPTTSDAVNGLPNNAVLNWEVEVHEALNPGYVPGADGVGSVVMGTNGQFTVVPPAYGKPPLLVLFKVQVNPVIPMVMALLPAPPCNSNTPGCPGYIGGGKNVIVGTVPIEAHHFNYDLSSKSYTGGPLPAPVTSIFHDLMGTVTVLYNGSPNAPVNVGTYAVGVSVSGGTFFAPGTLSLGNYNITRSVSVADGEKVILPPDVEEGALVTPVNGLSAVFTAGPNPVSKAADSVTFFWQGRALSGGTLSVYDAAGNIVRKVSVSGGGASAARRKVGSWDLRDSKGRQVAEGTYLVKGVVNGRDGSREHVSYKVGVVW